MRILLVNTFHYYRAGASVYTFEVAQLLERMGSHKVISFAMKHPLNLSSQYSKFFVPQIDLPKELARRNFRSGARVMTRAIYSNVAKRNLSQLLDEYPVDVAHIQNIHRHITPSIFHVLEARNVPIVWTLHDYSLLCPNASFFSKDRVCEACKGEKFYNVVINKCRKDSYAASFVVMLEEYIHRWLGLLKLVDYFIAPSNFLANKMTEYGFCPDKIIHFPYPIEVKSVNVSPSNNCYILYSGRLSYEKGLKTLIKAISLSDSARLLIAGDGPLKVELEIRAKNIAPKKVEFLGYLNRERLQKIVDGAMFIVTPSEWYENFPYAILEAFASAKPVIGSRIGGIPELVKKAETGLFFEPGNAEDLAAKIEWMIEHPKERREMGRQARELVEEECNPELHYERLMAVYRMALRKHGKDIDRLEG